MGKEISLIAFLDEVVSRNTQHYRKDFELDAQKLRDALNSPYMDERISRGRNGLQRRCSGYKKTAGRSPPFFSPYIQGWVRRCTAEIR